MAQKLPYMRMWWVDFLDDPMVVRMPPEAQGVYLLLLGLMWRQGAWIAANDSIIANKLGMHLLTWRMKFKPWIVPLLAHGAAPGVTGGIYTSERQVKEWERATRELRENSEKARRAREGKAQRNQPKRPLRPEPKTTSKPEPDAAPVTEPKPGPDHNGKDRDREEEQVSALQAERPVLAEPFKVPALQPIRPEPEPDDELRKRLVAGGLKRPSLSDIANLGRKP